MTATTLPTPAPFTAEDFALRRAAAEAAKDGGLMGFGANQVSEKDQAMFETVAG
jgi:hypothetical protein